MRLLNLEISKTIATCNEMQLDNLCEDLYWSTQQLQILKLSNQKCCMRLAYLDFIARRTNSCSK